MDPILQIENPKEITIEKITLFTRGSKRVQYLGIHLTKEVQNSYSENHRTLLKEIIKPRKNGKTSCAHSSEDLRCQDVSTH